MKSLKGGSAIGMLLTLLIISVLFVVLMPNLKNTGNGCYNNMSEVKSVESQAQDKIKEIEELRKQAEEAYKQDSQDY